MLDATILAHVLSVNLFSDVKTTGLSQGICQLWCSLTNAMRLHEDVSTGHEKCTPVS